MTGQTGNRGGLWLLAAGLIHLLLLTVWPLSRHWAADEQYRFGYLVPVLAGVLVFRRWKTRRAPSAPQAAAWRAAGALAIAFLPIWILLQPNPDWRLLNWVATGATVGFLLAVAGVLGGSAWVRHFRFPMLFLFTAVPWPTALEWPVTQGLMRLAAYVAAEVLSLGGVPAIAQGNLVEIAGGTLGVDLACSGIRSLQASLMFALFLGEMFRFGNPSRAVLVVGAVLIALVTNIVRVLILAVVASARGMREIERWHDPAGLVLMSACFLLLWCSALLLDKGSGGSPSAAEPGHAHPISAKTAAAILAWMVMSVFATEWWFRRVPAGKTMPWRFVEPAGATVLPIDAGTRGMLRFDRGAGWEWRDRAGRRWIAYHFAWEPGPTRSRLLLNMHRPDVCLPAVGMRLLEERGLVRVQVHGVEIPLQAYVFESGSGPLHVYYSLYRSGEPIVNEGGSVRDACLRAVVERRRSLAQDVLQIAVSGIRSAERADGALRETLAEIVRPADPG